MTITVLFSDSFMVRPKADDTIGVCERCNELCDLSMGCTGRGTTNCTRCAKAGILSDDKLVRIIHKI